MEYIQFKQKRVGIHKVAWLGERVCIEAQGDASLIPSVLTTSTWSTTTQLVVVAEGIYATIADGKKVWDVIAPLKQGRTTNYWLTVDVPVDIDTGFYSSPDGSLVLEVVSPQGLVLPCREDWIFHLDLWQNPWAVARYARCEPWSDEHFEVLLPHLRRLADTGPESNHNHSGRERLGEPDLRRSRQYGEVGKGGRRCALFRFFGI